MGQAIKKVVFMPPACTYTERKPRRVTFIKTKSGKKIPSYFLPAKSRKRDTCLIYSHGNATDIGSMNEFLLLLHEYLPNLNVFHYEYVGYGLAKKEGNPSEQMTYESAEAAMDFLIKTKGFKVENIIAYGTSLGGGPTMHIVTTYPKVKGLILECSFTSCCRVVIDKQKMLANMLEKTVDMFVNINKIEKIRCPALMFHGVDDDVVPFNHGLELWDKCPKSCKYKNIWVKNAKHHNIIDTLGPKVYIKILDQFIAYLDNDSEDRKTRDRLLDSKAKKGGLFSFSAAKVEIEEIPEEIGRESLLFDDSSEGEDDDKEQSYEDYEEYSQDETEIRIEEK